MWQIRQWSLMKRMIMFGIGSVFLAVFAFWYEGRYSVQIPHQQTSHISQQEALQSGAELVQQVIYEQCGDRENFVSRIDDALVGLTAADIPAHYPDWTISELNRTKLQLSRTEAGVCPRHAQQLYIGIRDGKAAIFYGQPSGETAILKEVTSISVQHLAPTDQETLKKGLVVHSTEELLLRLEGLQAQ